MTRTTLEKVTTVVTPNTIIEVEQMGRGCTGKVVDPASPLCGLEAWGDRWFVVAELDARAKAMPVYTTADDDDDADDPEGNAAWE